MAGEQPHGRRGAPVREGDPELAPHARGGGDPGDDLHFETPVHERLHLLAAAPEHQRVAALQTHHRRALLGESEEHALDLILGPGVEPRLLAHVQHVRPVVHQVEDRGRHEPVVQHHVRGLHQVERLERQQAGVAGARAHQVHLARVGDGRRRPAGVGGRARRRLREVQLEQAVDVLGAGGALGVVGRGALVRSGRREASRRPAARGAIPERGEPPRLRERRPRRARGRRAAPRGRGRGCGRGRDRDGRDGRERERAHRGWTACTRAARRSGRATRCKDEIRHFSWFGALSRESFLPNVTIARLLQTENPLPRAAKKIPTEVGRAARRKDENANDRRGWPIDDRVAERARGGSFLTKGRREAQSEAHYVSPIQRPASPCTPPA